LLIFKSYYDFYSDIYPETHDILKPAVSTLKWLHGQNGEQNKITLNADTQKTVLSKCGVRNPFASAASNGQAAPAPAPKNIEPVVSSTVNNTNTFKSNVSITLKPINDTQVPVSTPAAPVSNSTPAYVAPATNGNHVQQPASEPQYTPGPTVFRNTVITNGTVTNGSTNDNHGSTTNGTTAAPAPAVAPKPVDRTTKAKSVYYQSKYKYVDGKAAHRSEHITNIRNLSTMWPSECNGFQINSKHAAFLLSSTSGQIGVVEVIISVYYFHLLNSECFN
jgi:hypothetical protein